MSSIIEFRLIAAAWKFGINDPTLIAWIIVVGYLVAMWYCWRVARSTRNCHSSSMETTDSTSATFAGKLFRSRACLLWYLLGAIMLLMGVNKQLDLHSLIVPRIQKALFWNEYWSVNAVIFVVVTSFLAITGLIVGIRLLMRQSHRLQLAYLALATLLTLEMVRFSPNRFSKLLVYHLLYEDESWLHVHTIELLELAVLVVICWLARATIKHETQTEKFDSEGEVNANSDGIQA
ncbi:MAG: hypothetical protein U0930_20620 [Pirellulales bacterium]